jgi:threonine/homoserine/homoserine lactone efflux protein
MIRSSMKKDVPRRTVCRLRRMRRAAARILAGLLVQITNPSASVRHGSAASFLDARRAMFPQIALVFVVAFLVDITRWRSTPRWRRAAQKGSVFQNRASG